MDRDGMATLMAARGEGFIGCPRDAEPFAEELLRIWAGMPVPGLRPSLTFWRHDADLRSRTSAQPSQYHIARTSDPATNPVFILLGRSIGTPVRPPADEDGRRHWQALRAWLNGNGFGMVAMVGDTDFTNQAKPPDGKIPLSGTLFELFDAMRTDPKHTDPSCRGPQTFLRIFDLSALIPPRTSPEDAKAQQDWCALILNELKRSYTVLSPATAQDFARLSHESLREAFDFPLLNPWTDPLPGLEAVTETMPLLFGRDRLIQGATNVMFGERPPSLTLVEGVSGVGKSSFLRGGLMRTWFAESPPGAGLRHGWRALLAEPALLQLQPDEDPLATLGNLLAADPETEQPRERIVGPLPSRFPAAAPPLPAASGDRAADLRAAVAWWDALTQGANAPLILVLDQAEQVEAIARRGIDEEADPVLSPAWWRFTALLGALTGRLATEWLTAEVSGPLRKLTARMPVRLILGIHRRSTLNLWPWGAGESEPHRLRVEPISERQDWQELVERTCRAYGLDIDPALRDAMADEAHRLVREGQITLAASTGDAVGTEPAQSSILPLVKVALQHLIGGWVASHPPDGPGATADRWLDATRYGELSGIEGSINALGERAWRLWQNSLAQKVGLDPRGYFEQLDLSEQQTRDFGALMAGLVDQTQPDSQARVRVELADLPVDSPRARDREELVAALRTHRLLTRIEGRHLRVPHRAVFDHWQRAAAWVQDVAERRLTKARLRSRIAAGDGFDDWPERELEPFARLVLDWIGPQDEADRAVWGYLAAGLVARLDPASVGMRASGALDRLPYAAILARSDERFIAALIGKVIGSAAGRDQMGPLLLHLAQTGMAEGMESILGMASVEVSAIACWTDAESGASPLLQASQNGHEGCVARLLDAGAEPGLVNPNTGIFPLLQASQNGHMGCVARLLDAGADPGQIDPQDGGFPLLLASQNGHEGCVARLLEAGAEPRQIDPQDGGFPLLIASQQGHEGCVARLLDAGADPGQIDPSGIFPLLMASQNGHEGCVARLLDAGADPGQIDINTGIFPLLLASQQGHEGCVARLLDAGADPGLVNPNSGAFPLLMASQEGHEGCVARLLDAGAEPRQIDPNSGAFPLLLASQEGHEGCVARLLKAGADPEQIDPNSGAFPLLQASQEGHEGCVACLLDAGAEPGQIDPQDGV